jgi:hypothetical protein
MSRPLAGCDFSSSPSRRKPIVIATGALDRSRVLLGGLNALTSLDGFSAWLRQEQSWVCGFDLPFGLPRELVQTLGWPLTWQDCMRHYAGLSREDIRSAFAGFCHSRPVGGKFAHRATDLPAGSSPSMKWVNPPVAYMLHAGVPRLMAAAVHMPALQTWEQARAAAPEAAHLPERVGLEAYPGLLARELLQASGHARRSYKNDAKALQTPDRLIARKDMLTALENGQTRLGLRLKLSHAQRDALVDDGTGDALDAVLCLMQAAWAEQQHRAGDALYGLPPQTDPLEGWIVTA